MRFLLVLLLVAGCSSSRRTEYEIFKKGEGFRELAGESSLRRVNFQANAYTKKADAELFAKFRAIEVCKESGAQFAHMMAVRDHSESKEILRSNTTGFPSYYYGMYPFYNRFHSGFGLGFGTMSSNTWEETYVYPNITVIFECVDQAYGPEIVVREVSREDMKLLVKDLKGALQVEKIIKDSPNAGTLENGDVILRVRGERIETIPQLLQAFNGERREVPAEIMREGKRKKVMLKSKDITEMIAHSQQEIIASACRKKEIKERAICSGK